MTSPLCPSRRRRRRPARATVICLTAVLLAAVGVPAAAEPDGGAPPEAVAAAAPEDLGGLPAGAVLDSPPEPEAAAEQVLPLEVDPNADVDLDHPADPGEARTEERDLDAQQLPDVPASAVTFSTTLAGDASTLVLFDTTGPYAQLGEYYALGMGLLASHSGTVTTVPVSDYVAGLAGRYTAVIYAGSTYGEPLPEAFVDDVLTGDVPVLWTGFNIWQLAANDADRATFTERYGWDAATSYIDSVDTVTTVRYNGQDLGRNILNNGGILAPAVTDPQKVSVLGEAVCSSTDGVAQDCATLAQSTGSTFPWAVRSGNLTYIGEIPLAYIAEADRYLALADLVLDLTDPNSVDTRNAAIRIEDVSPGMPAADVQAMVDYLAREGVPFQIAVVPIYTDPNGALNDGIPETLTLADTPDLVAVLQDAVARGGTLIQHGTTHQYGDIANPYNGVTGDDFEFIPSWCSAENSVQAPALPCTDDLWVQIGGTFEGDSAAGTAWRVTAGREIFAQVGLPTPEIFEVPHYAASAASYEGITSVYQVRYERSLFYSGTLTGRPAGAMAYYGQFFPYTVHDPYGATILPENIGNYSPEEMNHHAPRLAPDVVAAARANLVIDHATASFFFHPYYDLAHLKEIVEGIRGAGYTFVPVTELR